MDTNEWRTGQGDVQMDRWTETKQKTHYRTTETQRTQHVLPLRASHLRLHPQSQSVTETDSPTKAQQLEMGALS